MIALAIASLLQLEREAIPIKAKKNAGIPPLLTKIIRLTPLFAIPWPFVEMKKGRTRGHQKGFTNVAKKIEKSTIYPKKARQQAAHAGARNGSCLTRGSLLQ
jgi:hypothetical protein